MKQFRYARTVSRVVTLAMPAAIVLSVVASLLYAGGSAVDKTAAHYSWAYNFFSDLGITKTYLEKSNLAGMIVADAALVLAGISVLLFGSLQSVIVARRQKAKGLAENSMIFAAFVGLGLVALAALPWNLHLELHLNLVKIVFAFTALYTLCLFVVQWVNRWPLPWRLLSLGYVLVTGSFLAVVIKGPALDTIHGIEVQAAAQKAVFYLTFVYFGLQALAVRRSLRHTATAE